MTTNSTQKKLKCHKIYYLFLIPYPYIFPSFPSFLPSVSLHLSCSNQWAYGPEFWLPRSTSLPEPKHCAIARCKVCASMYITYISVSKSTPLTVTGPNGQLASLLFSNKIVIVKFGPSWLLAAHTVPVQHTTMLYKKNLESDLNAEPSGQSYITVTRSCVESLIAENWANSFITD